MRRRVAWIGIAILAIYLVFIGGGWAGIYWSDLRATTVALAGIAIAGWAVAALRDPQYRPRSLLLPWLALALVSLGISTLFSREPRMSAEYLGYAVLLVAMYLLLVALMRIPFFRDRIVALTTLLFMVIAAELIGGVAILWIRWWMLEGGISQPPLRPYFIGLSYGNPSAVLTMVALLGVPAAARVARTRRRVPALAVLVGVVALVALLSGSRAGWLALTVAGGLGIGLALASPFGRFLIERLRQRLASLGTAARIGAAMATAIAVGIGVLVFLPAVLERIGSGGEDLRAGYIVSALRLFESSPIVGTGPGSWPIARIAATSGEEIDYFVPHAHDVPAQTLAELGIVGALAGVLLIVAVARLIVGAFRSDDRDRRWWAYLAAVGLTYFAVHNLIDFYANMPAALFAAALPIAYLDATAEAPIGMGLRSPLGRRTTAAGAAVTLAVALALLAQELPAQWNEAAVRSAGQGDWSAAAQLAGRAAASDAAVRPYLLTAGLAAARTGDLAAAADDFRAVAQGDDLSEAWLDLASVEASLGSNADALQALARALRLGVQRPEVAMPAADLALRLGAADLATSTFAVAMNEIPSLVADPWWQAQPDRAALWPAVVERALKTGSGTTRWEIALMAGQDAQARTFAAADPLPGLASDVVAAWLGDQTANARLLASCRADLLDTRRVDWCARIAARDGDQGAAETFRQAAEGVEPGSSAAGYEARVQVGDMAGTPLPQRAAFWGLYTYRRPTPPDTLVPDLVHLVLT